MRVFCKLWLSVSCHNNKNNKTQESVLSLVTHFGTCDVIRSALRLASMLFTLSCRFSFGWEKMPLGTSCYQPCAPNFPRLFYDAFTIHHRWLPFSLTTVLVGADFIIMTSHVAGGLVDHVHQARARWHPYAPRCCHVCL